MPSYEITINATGGTIGINGRLMATVLEFFMTSGAFSGTDGSNGTVQTNPAGGSHTTQNTGSITTTVNGDIVVGGFSAFTLVGTFGTGSGWTFGEQSTDGGLSGGTSPGSFDEYRIQASAGAINPEFDDFSPTSSTTLAGVTGAFANSGGVSTFRQKARSPFPHATSVTVTLGAQPLAGSVIVVLAYTGLWSTNNTGFSVNNDSFGNSYTLLVQNLWTAGNITAAILYLAPFAISAIASPSGVSMASGENSPSPSAGVIVTPAGVSMASGENSPSPSAGVIVTPLGVSAVFAVGTPIGSSNSNNYPSSPFQFGFGGGS